MPVHWFQLFKHVPRAGAHLDRTTRQVQPQFPYKLLQGVAKACTVLSWAGREVLLQMHSMQPASWSTLHSMQIAASTDGQYTALVHAPMIAGNILRFGPVQSHSLQDPAAMLGHRGVAARPDFTAQPSDCCWCCPLMLRDRCRRLVCAAGGRYTLAIVLEAPSTACVSGKNVDAVHLSGHSAAVKCCLLMQLSRAQMYTILTCMPGELLLLPFSLKFPMCAGRQGAFRLMFSVYAHLGVSMASTLQERHASKEHWHVPLPHDRCCDLRKRQTLEVCNLGGFVLMWMSGAVCVSGGHLTCAYSAAGVENVRGGASTARSVPLLCKSAILH